VLKITDDDAHGCLLLEPVGALSRRDLDGLTERFDAWVARHDGAPNLVIRADSFPTWTDFAALGKHLRFIRTHHRLVEKVAIVSDARAFDVAPKLAGLVVSAELRHFRAGELDAALDWVAVRDPEAGRVSVMEGLPDDVVGLSVEGVIGARDYAEVIVPLIESKLKTHDRIKMLYRIGPQFEAFTPGAVWSDTLVGVKHLTAFSRVAVVSDVEWIRHSVRAFAPLMPAEIHVFAESALPDAKAWIAA
jgi:hypothetical protein